MSERVLIVGGNGYLGTSLKEVLAADYEISVTGTKPNSDERYYQIDFCNSRTYQSLVNLKFDIIIVLAASITGLGLTDINNKDLKINTVQLGSFLQFVADNDISKKIIFASSMTVYAKTDRLPVNETDNLQPLSTYGLSKLIGENIMSFLADNAKIKVLTLRLPGIYGGQRQSGFIFNTIGKALNDEPIELNVGNLGYWETIEINDLCYLLHQLILGYNWKGNYEVINVCYGEPTDLADTAKFIVKELSSKSEITIAGSYSDLFMSNKKLLRFVKIKSGFYDSLRRYIKFCQNALRNS